MKKLRTIVAVFALQLTGWGALAAQTPPTVHAGDKIMLKVWREPDYTSEIQVRGDGFATFPRIGELRVGGETDVALREKLTRLFSDYLTNPSIEIIVLRRVNVSGAVAEPGVYFLDPTMTIADALAMAGGSTTDGKRGQVELYRGGEKLPVRIDTQARLVEAPLQTGDHLVVPERSWFVRNSGLLGAVISGSVGVLGLAIALGK